MARALLPASFVQTSQVSLETACAPLGPSVHFARYKSAIRKAKLGQREELDALKRLDDQARALEQLAKGPSVEQLIAQERERSHLHGGRSVFGVEPPPKRAIDGRS